MTAANQPPILYPVACDKDGFAVHIDDWERGHDVTCFGCDKELIGRLPHDGIKPTAHFAHKSDATCNGETALHKAAEAAILHAHATGALQTLSWECPQCTRYRHQTSLRDLVLTKEKSPCEGVVSDVLARDPSGKPVVAIEVVVTHDIEAKTLERYHASGLDVFAFFPSWVNIGDLSRGVVSLDVDHRVGVVDTSSCAGCQALLREKHEWEERERARQADQWWGLWAGLWRSVGNEARLHGVNQQWADQRLRDLDDRLWTRFASLWPRMIQTTIDAWWISWHQLWVDLGAEHVRPYRWMQRWLDAWEMIGRQYAADAIERERQRRYRDDRRDVWWATWIRVWKDIGQRESGAMAAWKPICRKCRDDLRPDHRCPRVDAASPP